MIQTHVLTFSHEIIRTGKGALGGREGERRRVATSTGFQERNLKHGKKSKTFGSLKVVEGCSPVVVVRKRMGLRKGGVEGKRRRWGES